MESLVATMETFIRRHWRWLGYVVVFAGATAVLGWLQWSKVFADPDSFYHAKIALLIRDHGLVFDFPWLRLTTLGQAYTDQHLLYHVILIPFVSIWPPLVGLKIATVLFGSTLITVAYWFMRQFHVRWPIVFTAILLFSRPFSFRISLAKAPSTSIIILLIGLAWIFRYQFKRLFILSFTYVWYYGGFALLGVAATVYGVISVLYNRFVHRMTSAHLLAKIRGVLGSRFRDHDQGWPNLRVVLVVMAGLLAGIIINPYFPKNVVFYSQQLINIGVINFQRVIGVGGEWYPYHFGDLMADTVFATILILLALLGIVANWRSQRKQTWTMAALTVFFFLLTMKSRRYVEYYVPIAILFAAMSITDTLAKTSRRILHDALPGPVVRTAGKRVGIVALTVVLFMFGYIAGRDAWQEKADLSHGFPMTKFAPVGKWLAANTPAGSRIVHSDWDEFPVLFYEDSHNTYIAGLDPTFLYKANTNTYWTWANITLGKFTDDVYRAVTVTLGSRYVLVANNHDLMDQYFRNNPDFKKIYQDAEATVYEAVGVSAG